MGKFGRERGNELVKLGLGVSMTTRVKYKSCILYLLYMYNCRDGNSQSSAALRSISFMLRPLAASVLRNNVELKGLNLVTGCPDADPFLASPRQHILRNQTERLK